MSLDVAVTWAGSQCVIPDARAQLIEHLASTAEHHRDCSALVGPTLTRRGKPYLVHSVSGECFVFELTPEQSRCLAIQHNMLVSIIGHQREERGRQPPRIVSLEELSIKHNAAVHRWQPITGTLHFRMHTSYAFPLAIRLSYDSPSGLWITSRYLCPRVAMSDTVNFSFPPFASVTGGKDANYAGPIAMFFQLCGQIQPDDPQWWVPISDIRGVLVNIQ